MAGSAMDDISKLMQPGEGRWDSAACRGDDRFIEFPGLDVLPQLGKICAGCELFDQCAKEFKNETGVFIAGEWMPEE